MNYLENALHLSSQFAVYILEIIGIIIIFYGAIEALWLFFKSGMNYADRDVIINLGEALSLSLTFNLGAEIIKTITVQGKSDLISLGAVVFIRIIITILLHWELKQVEEGNEGHKKVQEHIQKLKSK